MLAIVNDDLAGINNLQISTNQFFVITATIRVHGDKEGEILGFCIFIERWKHDQIGTLSNFWKERLV